MAVATISSVWVLGDRPAIEYTKLRLGLLGPLKRKVVLLSSYSQKYNFIIMITVDYRISPKISATLIFQLPFASTENR